MRNFGQRGCIGTQGPGDGGAPGSGVRGRAKRKAERGMNMANTRGKTGYEKAMERRKSAMKRRQEARNNRAKTLSKAQSSRNKSTGSKGYLGGARITTMGFAKGGMVKANCGASMKPNRKAKK